MRTPPPRLAAILALLGALAACDSSGTDHDSDSGATVELRTPKLAVTVRKAPFTISVADSRGVLLAEAPAMDLGSLAYWRGDDAHHVVRTTGPRTRGGGRVTFDVETTEGPGANASVSVELGDDGTVVVELAPSAPETVTAAGDTFVASAGERYYGLTERIISDGRLGSASEVAPQAVGSLDRRGELVPISVAPTIAIYTPFLHSSRGYGLFVDGPMEGRFDVASTQSDRLAVRFNFDPTELVPYSYSEGVRANQSGHPIATPLVFEYPSDPAVGDLWDEYLYGPWLLVAPIWRDGERTRAVYLPAGAWTDFWDDAQLLVGPLTLPDVSVPLDRVALYIRLGAIIPLEVVNSVTGFGSEASAGRLTLAIYPHQTSRYDLRQEGGATIAITSAKQGAYDQGASIRVTTSAATLDYLLRIQANFAPASVTLNGTRLSECVDQAAIDDPNGTCTWLSEEGRRVLVKYSTAGSPAAVVLTPGSG